MDFKEGWAAGWHRRRFRDLVGLPQFHAVVTLARLANMLRFVYSVSIKLPGQGPEARRQRMNAFYLSGALLVEAERTIQGVGTCFSKQDDFIQLVKIVHSDSFQEVVGRFRLLRNQSGFHFDQQPVEPALRKLARGNRPFMAFLTAYGTANKDMYYDLGDDVAMGLILGEEEPGEWLGEWIGLSAKVLNEVFDAVDEFIAGRLDAWNPEVIPTKDDRPDDIEETRRIVSERRKEGESPASS